MRKFQADSPYSWCVAVATLVLSSVSFGATNSVPILFPEISSELSWDGAGVASLYAATMFGAAVSSLLMGRLLDKIGFFFIGFISTFSMCVGLVLASVSTAPWHLYVAYAFFIGVGQGAFLSTVAAAVAQWFLKNRSLAIAIALCGQGLGGLLAPPFLRALTVETGWRDALLTYAGLSLILMIAAVMLYLPKSPVALTVIARHLSLPSMSRKKGTTNTLILWMAFGLLLANSGSMGVASHLVAYGVFAGLSSVSAGALMSIHWGFVLIARLVVGYTLDRVDKYQVLLVATCIQIFGTCLIFVGDSVPMVAIGAAFIGIGFGGYYPAYGAIIQAHYPKGQVGQRMTELYLSSFIAAGFGTWLMGVLFDIDGGFDLGFMTALLLTLSSLAVVVWCKKRIKGESV